MSFTRRELLKLGSAGTMAALVPRLAAISPQEAPGKDASPLDQRYLLHGLNVLCSAHATDSFFTGHSGGAVIAAWFLCREESLEPGTTAVIRSALDRYYPIAPDPFPDEQPLKDGVATLLQALEDGIDQLWRDGHNVIFLALALRALHELPEAVTPSRVQALLRTIQTLEPRVAGKGGIEIPESTTAFSRFVLEEFLASTEGGPGQGYSGHVLTHGRAILDLRLLGHEDFARKCLNAYQLALRTARPKSARKDYTAERPKKPFVFPDRQEYWKRRVAAEDLELGHLFKYPYGFLGLRRHSSNLALNDVCTANSFRLFRS
jgi:hypothetical protein